MCRIVPQILLLIIFNLSGLLSAQELNCTVEVISQKITGVDNATFKNLERTLSEILNTTAWSNTKFDSKEKISCTFILTLEAKTAANTYQANAQIQANRPVFNSSYTSSLLNHRDKQVQFTFLPNESLQYIANGKNNELVAVAAYYAYLIIGLDADSYAHLGGSQSFKKAQNIVFQQGKEVANGWSATEHNINRYWIIENLLNHKALRQTSYRYHREGLDQMVENPRQAMENLLQSIENLEKVHKHSSDLAAMHLFFDAKANEISQSARMLPSPKRKKLHRLLAKIDPGHLGIYKVLE